MQYLTTALAFLQGLQLSGALAAWSAVGFNLLVAAFIYGQLAQQTKTNTSAIKEIKEEQIRQWSTIGSHTTSISECKVDIASLQASSSCPAVHARVAHTR